MLENPKFQETLGKLIIQDPKDSGYQRIRLFMLQIVVVYSSLYDLLTKSKAKHTKIESPPHFYLSKGMAKKQTKA
jgi:hypothetical protein